MPQPSTTKQTLSREEFVELVAERLDAGASTTAITDAVGRSYAAVFSRLDRAEEFDLLKQLSDRRAAEAFDRNFEEATR